MSEIWASPLHEQAVGPTQGVNIEWTSPSRHHGPKASTSVHYSEDRSYSDSANLW